MIGLAMLFAFIVYLVFGYLLYLFIKSFDISRLKVKVITLLILVGVPLGDVIPGKLYLKYKCATEAGLDIRETVNVDGYSVGDEFHMGCGSTCNYYLRKWYDHGRSMYIDSQVDYLLDTTFGMVKKFNRFEYVEVPDDRCELQNIIRNKFPLAYKSWNIPNGYCVSSTVIEKPADYLVTSIKWEKYYSVLFGVARVISLVQEADSLRILGSNTGFTHRGGWLRRWFGSFMAVGKPDECFYRGSNGMTWALLEGVFID
ncbi:MAG: hypothetical protein ABFS22_06950 [Pseudomonadota bacterium]